MGCVSVMIEAGMPEGIIRDWLSLPMAPAELERQLGELGSVEVVAVSMSGAATELGYSHARSDTARDLNVLALAIESTLADSHALAFAGVHARRVAKRQGREPAALDYAGGIVHLWQLAGDESGEALRRTTPLDADGIEWACGTACAERRRNLVGELPGAVSWLEGASEEVGTHDRNLATTLASMAREARALYGDGPLGSLGVPVAACAAHVRPSTPDWLAGQLAEQASQEVAQYESERAGRRRERRARRGEGHGR